MLVIEMAKEKEPGATGNASTDQGTEKPHACSGVGLADNMLAVQRMYVAKHALTLPHLHLYSVWFMW